MSENKLPSTAELVKKYQLNARKSLGQNFIFDQNFTDKIARAASGLTGDLKNSVVLEIGPGPGGLSRSILDAGVKKLVVIEKDERCLQALHELKNFYGSRLEIVEGDALVINEMSVLAPFLDASEKFQIIANLPYNIGTILLFKWLKIVEKISSMHLMLQKEVVERIVARPDSKDYGRLAVMVQFLCEVKMLFSVNRAIFTPQPKVTSAIVEIVPRQKKFAEVEFNDLEKIVAAAFNQRRKMVKAGLKTITPHAEEILTSLKINPNLRAENLSLHDFCRITSAMMSK